MSGLPVVTPGISSATENTWRPVGRTSSTARGMTDWPTELRVSTTGDSPVTVTLSSSPPTFSSMFSVAVKAVGSSMPSRFTVVKPVRSKVTV